MDIKTITVIVLGVDNIQTECLSVEIYGQLKTENT